MTLKVEVMEKATVKPSSPTPHHLKAFKLSLIDQLAPPIPVSVILFYSVDQQSNNEDQLDLIKRSLSETLNHFYPLAGRISDNQYIDCNDDGVKFVKTQVSSQLSQIVSNPKAEQLAQLLPIDNFLGLGPKVLLSIQANVFNCGGMALGIRISHKAADTSSLSLFLCNWASIAKVGETYLVPELNNTSLFPPVGCSPPPSSQDQDPSPNLVSKRFIFSGSDIAALKSKTSSIQVPLPTKVEAVIALIWLCCMRAESVKVASFAKIAVNVRGKMVPPLSQHFGNVVTSTMTTITALNIGRSEPELINSLVIQLRESIRRIDGDYCQKLGTCDGFQAYLDSIIDVRGRVERGELQVYMFTSWCRFPFYEIDFGWGKPVWTSFGLFSGRKVAALMDTKCGNGIEVWVTLDKANMDIFESDPELLFFTSNQSQGLPQMDIQTT